MGLTAWGLLGPEMLQSERRTRTLGLRAAVRGFNDFAVPGLGGAVVLTLRGGDFVFDSGQDLAIGYDSHDAENVHLYLQESFSFHVATPEAAVPLKATD